MTLEELREQIDVLDRQLVELLSERARAAIMIGHLKAATSLPVYEPVREKVIYANVRAVNKGPLPDIELTRKGDLRQRARGYQGPIVAARFSQVRFRNRWRVCEQ